MILFDRGRRGCCHFLFAHSLPLPSLHLAFQLVSQRNNMRRRSDVQNIHKKKPNGVTDFAVSSIN